MKPDRGRVVAHAYRDDAVIAICRQCDALWGYGRWSWPLVQVHRRVGSEQHHPAIISQTPKTVFSEGKADSPVVGGGEGRDFR